MARPSKAEINTSQAFKYHWMIWKYYGLQPPQRDSKWFKPYIVYAICLNFSILLFPISLIIKVILSKNVTEMCENLYNTITDVNCNIKFFNIFLVRRKLLKVNATLKHLDSRAETEKEKAILEEAIVTTRKLVVIFARLLVCALTTSQMLVYLASERTLMYPAWFPWDWKASTKNFYLAHSYQLYALHLQAIQNLLNDTYPPAYLIILSAHTKALASRIRDLSSTDTSTEEELYQRLTDCIKDHKTIHRLFLDIQETISTACFVQFVATGLAQCTIGVYMQYVGNDPSIMLNLFFYFTAITAETFLLCYYGDLYCQASDHLTESIYNCNWMDRSEKFKKTFLFMLTRSQMSTTIMAGNLFPVGMPTFVKVMKTAYSVFTVLNESK